MNAFEKEEDSWGSGKWAEEQKGVKTLSGRHVRAFRDLYEGREGALLLIVVSREEWKAKVEKNALGRYTTVSICLASIKKPPPGEQGKEREGGNPVSEGDTYLVHLKTPLRGKERVFSGSVWTEEWKGKEKKSFSGRHDASTNPCD